MRQVQIERGLAAVDQTFVIIVGLTVRVAVLKRVGQLTILVRQQPLAVVDGKGQGSAFSWSPAVRVQRIAFGQRDLLRDQVLIRRRTVCQTAFIHLDGRDGYRNIFAVHQIDLDVDRRVRRVVISVLCREREAPLRGLSFYSRSIRVLDLAGGRIIPRLQLAAIFIADDSRAFRVKRCAVACAVRYLQAAFLQAVGAGLQRKAAVFRRIGARSSALPAKRIVGIAADRELRRIVHNVHLHRHFKRVAVGILQDHRHRICAVPGLGLTFARMLKSVTECVFQLAVLDYGRSVRTLSLDALDGVALGSGPLRRLARRIGVRTVRKTFFIHDNHAVSIIDDRTFGILHRYIDGLLSRTVAVGIRDLEGEAVLTLRIRVRLVAVRTIGIHRQRAVIAFYRHAAAAQGVVHRHRLAVLRRRDGEALVSSIIRAEVVADLARHRIGCRTGFHFADSVAHAQRRHVVHNVHRDGRTVAVAVRIHHRHGQLMGNLRVRSGIALVVFRGVPVERIAEIQLARDRVIARHGQGAFICGHNVAGQLAVFENHHIADDDGGHAVRNVDIQGTAGRSGRSGLTRLRTARQAAFIHRQIDRTRFRAGSDGHIVVDIDFRGAGLHGIRSKLRAAVETDIQTPQMIDAVQQIAAAVLVIAAAA